MPTSWWCYRKSQGIGSTSVQNVSIHLADVDRISESFGVLVAVEDSFSGNNGFLHQMSWEYFGKIFHWKPKMSTWFILWGPLMLWIGGRSWCLTVWISTLYKKMQSFYSNIWKNLPNAILQSILVCVAICPSSKKGLSLWTNHLMYWTLSKHWEVCWRCLCMWLLAGVKYLPR